jgi:hypothetical protein
MLSLCKLGIPNFDIPPVFNENVTGVQVSMSDVVLVDVFNCSQEMAEDVNLFGLGHAAEIH